MRLSVGDGQERPEAGTVARPTGRRRVPYALPDVQGDGVAAHTGRDRMLQPMNETTQQSIVGRTVLLAKTIRMICASCKRSFVILKGGEYDCGECEHCENTSFFMEDGRPWGPKHRLWDGWVRSPWYLTDSNVVTEETAAIFDGGEDISEYMVLASPTPAKRRSRRIRDKHDPRDISILGGDPSL